jgi:hypothetical protein
MKLKRLILVLGLLIAANNLFGQTNNLPKKLLQGFDAASQSNVDVIASGRNDEVPCPPEYTNVISNTNLFTPDEQKLLNDITLTYGDETSNSIPPGSVLVSFQATPMLTYWGTNWLWIAHLKFTNTDLTDEISPGGDLFRHKVRNKDGDGYDFGIIPTKFDLVPYGYTGAAGPEFWFQQIKHGSKDGLYVEIIHGDHCSQWMRYSNGMAVDKKLYWDPNYNKFMIWAKFKEPFDIDGIHKHIDPEEAKAMVKMYTIMGERDECYDAARVFYKQTSRWPTNMIELSNFAHSHSDDPFLGRFDPSFYKEAKLTLKADGDLVIEYQSRETFNGQDKMVVDVDKPKPPQ